MDAPRRPLDRIDLGLIAVLILLAAGMRLWQVAHTEVLARDSIGFIRMAHEMETLGWSAAITSPNALQHPGYPLTVLAVHRLGGSWLGDEPALAWQLAAQIASCVASLVLVVPVYLLGRRLFDRGVACASVLILQGVPAIGRLLGDGLSEAVFLCFVAFAFWTALRAFDTGKPTWFLLCGLTSGFAYFVRPEGLLVALCTGLVLLVRVGRQPVRAWLAQGGTLTLGAGVCVAVFVAATGTITMKPTALRFGRDLAPHAQRTGGPLFAAWDDTDEVAGRGQRFYWAGKQLGLMLARGTFYAGWVFALLALVWYRDRLAVPGVAVMGLVSLLICLLMFRVAWYLGYLSDRHLAIVVLAATPFVAAGLIEAGRRVPRGGVWLSVVLVLALVVPATYRTLLPLHNEREGFREAGLWLAQHTNPGDEVMDPFAWSHYYAGRVFVERGAAPASQPPVAYVVRENAPNSHIRHRQVIAEHDRLRDKGRLLQSWPIRKGAVEVWAVPAAR